MGAGILSSWTIYDHPLDYPDGFIARRFQVKAGRVLPTGETITGGTLDEVRFQLVVNRPDLVCLARDPSDHANVVETWI